MSFTTSFVAGLKRLDAERLQQSARAAIQANGRLSLTVEAGRLMHLDDDKSIIIFAAANGDLGAVVSNKGDKSAFELKKAGAYYYLTFKNYLQEQGIDYKHQRIVYDISELGEKFEGRTIYRFARRVLPPKDMKAIPVTYNTPSLFSDEDFKGPGDAKTPEQRAHPTATTTSSQDVPSPEAQSAQAKAVDNSDVPSPSHAAKSQRSPDGSKP